MNCLIKKAKIIDRNSSWNGKTMDILIKKGKIEEIGEDISQENVKTITLSGLCISPGWMDIGTAMTEPGFEDLDDVQTLARSAIQGGFTALAVFPNTKPVIDNKAMVDSIAKKTNDLAVDFIPVGAITTSCSGKDLAEMFDMNSSGALAFSDGRESLQHSGVMLRALRYGSMLKLAIINRPDDRTISESGMVDEGIDAVNVGLPGMPVLAETMMLQRDIQLCEYVNGYYMAHLISTSESLRLIKLAKKDNLNVKASVSWHNLVETSKVLGSFDPNHKVMPPLRNKSHKNALIKGLNEGIIDCIVSNHVPVDLEEKRKAFSDAAFGALGLEQMFGVLRTKLYDSVGLENLIDKISNGPREAIGMPTPSIEVGNDCNITLFAPDQKWIFQKSDIQSKSANAPYIGMELTGKVIGIYNNARLFLNNVTK